MLVYHPAKPNSTPSKVISVKVKIPTSSKIVEIKKTAPPEIIEIEKAASPKIVKIKVPKAYPLIKTTHWGIVHVTISTIAAIATTKTASHLITSLV